MVKINTTSRCKLFNAKLKKSEINKLRPYIFVTNGGGKTEQERCLDLSRQLEMAVSPGQFICGVGFLRSLDLCFAD